MKKVTSLLATGAILLSSAPAAFAESSDVHMSREEIVKDCNGAALCEREALRRYHNDKRARLYTKIRGHRTMSRQRTTNEGGLHRTGRTTIEDVFRAGRRSLLKKKLGATMHFLHARRVHQGDTRDRSTELKRFTEQVAPSRRHTPRLPSVSTFSAQGTPRVNPLRVSKRSVVSAKKSYQARRRVSEKRAN